MVSLGSFDVEKAEYEGDPITFTFCGEEFEIAHNVGGMPMLQFAAAAKSGVGSGDMDGLAAMFSMIRDCLKPDEYRAPTEEEKAAGNTKPVLVQSEWNRFQDCAAKNRAPTALLMDICTAIYGAIAGRPLAVGSDSGPGPSSNGRSSNGSVSVSSEITTELASKKPANVKRKTTG